MWNISEHNSRLVIYVEKDAWWHPTDVSSKVRATSFWSLTLQKIWQESSWFLNEQKKEKIPETRKTKKLNLH